MSNESTGIIGIVALVVIGALLLGAVIFGYPLYNVWSSEMDGKAKLAESESSRQIAVVESKAKMDSAKNLADAEVIRAQGVAKANEIIGESLKDNSEYLDYLWLTEKIGASDKEIIYIPTETQLPILEATRLQAARGAA
ncbi:MAG: membrane protease subunit [Candidatus Omnitrophica bacterium]|nr:membrane protease subunit [Candidatus Omnitrophota bacterium]